MMKTLQHKIMAGLGAMAVIFTISSCKKGFDSNTYKPVKPLPIYDGYSNSKDIEPASLVAYWPFNGSLADSLSSTTGVATGTSFVKGTKGQGLQGANNGYVVSDVPAAVKALHSFTISTWVNMPQNTTGAIGLLDIANNQKDGPGFWGSLGIYFDNGATATTGLLRVHAFNVSASPTGKDVFLGAYTVTNPWGTWINVAVSYDDTAGKFTVYYNGASVGTSTITGFAPLDWSKADKMVFGTLQFQTTPSLTASTTSQPWAGYLLGTLDQVRIYNKVLNSEQMDAIYNLEKAGR
jgi:hypothetical protein